VEAAIASDAPILIVGGGDGTIRAVGARLAGTGRTMAILPLGTLNLLARDIGMPLDPLEAAAALGAATPYAIDVGEVNGQTFLCQSVLGITNTVGRARQRFRRKGGLYVVLRVVMTAIRALMRQRPLRLMVNAPGWERPWRLWTRAMSIVNNGYDEATGAMFHRPRLDSGELHIYVSRNFSIGWTARMMLAMALGIWKRSSDINILTGARFAVHSRRRRLVVFNDGEGSVLRTPLQYSIRPRALTLLSPAHHGQDTDAPVAAGELPPAGKKGALASGPKKPDPA